MNWDTVEGNWSQWSGKLREQWGKLTDDELQQAKGNREQVEGLIQERYGKSKDEARKSLDDWMARNQ